MRGSLSGRGRASSAAGLLGLQGGVKFGSDASPRRSHSRQGGRFGETSLLCLAGIEALTRSGLSLVFDSMGLDNWANTVKAKGSGLEVVTTSGQ